ncbi:uncharacterized protein LOC127799039 isoform X2 [Diospyros lotus]|uniref:uncharacterized protein LOC127799039 isoform X2 n=1 Tax=Diospyros lotus TaxID=55363 RepID=UPI002250DC8D|nr:uncharacterized protein LOC127799039 isoform X2 [Diospyros lotus]
MAFIATRLRFPSSSTIGKASSSCIGNGRTARGRRKFPSDHRRANRRSFLRIRRSLSSGKRDEPNMLSFQMELDINPILTRFWLSAILVKSESFPFGLDRWKKQIIEAGIYWQCCSTILLESIVKKLKRV